ncbi:MAG: NAD(P)-dependent dehydrogenase (short-subunit alcohol dehydrogenase family) [Candidatus Azotimanducaceae bacterium]|jgi:NAD(P)-dependent dehydrogenase (short-subunit alcohol dehydrogenase family)
MTNYKESDIPSQDGRTIFITGANTGIGFDTARVLALSGARVLLGCRSEEKAAGAIKKIKDIKDDVDISWVPLDLTSLASIEAAAGIVSKETKLDALVNNAGVMIPPKQETSDGFELQFGVNHLGHFALTGHLLHKLKDQPGARIVNVSSLAHRNGRINYKDIHAEKKYDRMARYSMSKFANILFMYELQRRLKDASSPAISVACHPGGSATELGRYLPPFLSLLLTPLNMLMNTPAEGALPTLMATTSAQVQGGDYFGPMRMGELIHSAHKVNTIAASKDEVDAARLWDLSTELTGVEFVF